MSAHAPTAVAAQARALRHRKNAELLDTQQLQSLRNAFGASEAISDDRGYGPIFCAHHTMIDRLWRLWQIRHPNPHMTTQLLNQALPPFPLTVAQTLDIKALGYDYAASTAHATVP